MLIWAVAFLMLLVATFISAIVTCFLQDKAKRISVDILLGLSTVTALFAFSEALFTPKTQIDPTVTSGYVNMADVASISLSYHPPKDANSFVSAICSFGGESEEEGSEASLKTAEKFVKKLTQKAPLNCELLARLSIIEHAQTSNTKDAFQDFDNSRADISQETSHVQAVSSRAS